MEISREQKLKLYTNLVRCRKLDELMVQRFHEGAVRPYFHSERGQEAVGVGACTFLRPDDYIANSHRGDGMCEVIPKGLPMKLFVAEHYGKATGVCQGMTGFYACDLDYGLLGLGGTVGEQFIATGVGIACQQRNKGQLVAAFFGDGATGRGSFHTAMLMSANWKLPVVFCCSNNLMGMWVPIKEAYPRENLADLAFGYGIPACVVDGQDVEAVYRAFQTAAERARTGGGPSFIEFKTYRFRCHDESHQDFCGPGYRDPYEIEQWKKRDPVELYREKLLEEGVLTRQTIDDIDRAAGEEVAEADKFAMESPYPDPSILQEALYAD